MKNSIGIAFAAVVVLVGACVSEGEDEQRLDKVPEVDQRTVLAASPPVLESRVDLRCTISCTFWNACRARNLGNPAVCGPEPQRCCCATFHEC